MFVKFRNYQAEFFIGAIDCGVINRLSFGDALIVPAAESANCEMLWTGNLKGGQVIRGVRIDNP